MGPMALPLNDDQWYMLTQLQDNEAWLVQPATAEMGSLVWTPGVRLGVQPGSAFAQAAHNVPVLGVIRVESTEEAGRLQRKLSQERCVCI